MSEFTFSEEGVTKGKEALACLPVFRVHIMAGG